ncbi:class III poly(R)-hydroxyalkanoic acid synthase subunit PhaE [Luteimonas sp. RD2P54]|uniref:Poly(3-hydroxyalkanoate) polymerase subunit PhaE n=1 Tax=Luteimonas endophytica TaxID=3042023 RepID=A0ABT6J9K2_9GAMM|nr:class III poly(R)-hydroxyalkanoic acid synthase subunit PhaE [Luteimonas endophytica]MDH5823488.1 class III poly(R)-hydroxyalkanoic acid synthase subunit PhaE [Luteimonas endophytica]
MGNGATDEAMGGFEKLAQQYWSAWGEAMRAAAPAAASAGPGQAGMQAWHDAIDWWTKSVHGNRAGVNDAVARFQQQAHGWFGQMQQVAARFAGQQGSAADVAKAWREALGASGENPFPEMFRAMRGHGLQGLDQWIDDASPYLDAWRRESASWLRMPAFGPGREHQERLQALAQAQADYQEHNNAYNALMLKASQSAFEIFEGRLLEREEPGRQIESPRALFDLWIDAAEEAYAEIALSEEFRAVYGRLVNAQMRLRAGIQREVEQVSAMFGMPTRSELDGAHRKIVELERAVRRMRDQARPAPAPAERSAGRVAAPKKPASRGAVSSAGKAARKTSKKRTKQAPPRAANKTTGKSAGAASRTAVRKSATGKGGR